MPLFRALCLILLVIILAIPAAAQEAPVSPAAVIQAFLAGTTTAIGPETVKLAPLKALYGPRQAAPLWLDAQGQPTATAKEAVILLGQAEAEGLHAAAYHLASLEATAAPHTPQESAGFELLLSEGLGLYLHDLRVGRTPVGHLRDASYNETFDPLPSLLAASTDTPAALNALVAGLAPSLPDYAALRKALADLRTQAGWPVLPPGGSLKPGMTDPAVAALRTRLGVEPGKKPQFYDEQLAGAVKAFQEWHAVKDDGAVGKDTRQALDMPVQARIDEVIAAMERLRWLPRDLGPRHVLVDVGGFWVRLVDNRQSTLQLGVIVGTTERETPQLMSAINTVVVNPTWTVPPTIIKEDLLPKLAANPGYLAGRHIDLYRKTDDGLEPASADDVRRGNFNEFVFRQPAGEKNPLGRFKLLFPNAYSIYLHDTPEKEKFTAALRTFSSGCVRVQDVRQLAEALLAGVRTHEQIDADLATTQTKSYKLPATVPIYIFYASAWLGPQGQLIFGPDLYEQDSELAAAL